jgi:hypothetical protein
MKISNIETKIYNLEALCDPFLQNIEEDDVTSNDNMALKVKAFNEIVTECKDEVESSDTQHKIHILKLLYGLEIDEYELASVDDSLDDYVSGQIDNTNMEVNERKINTLKSILSDVNGIIEELSIEYKNTLHVSSKWYRFEGGKLKKLRKLLKTLLNLKEKLEAKLESDSNLYIFFSFLISLAIKKRREILLIEIANRLDRYIDVIEPSFSGRFLYHDDMIYHYAIYEIKELKQSIFIELAPQ